MNHTENKIGPRAQPIYTRKCFLKNHKKLFQSFGIHFACLILIAGSVEWFYILFITMFIQYGFWNVGLTDDFHHHLKYMCLYINVCARVGKHACIRVWFWFHLANSDLVYRNYSLSISQSISADRIVSCTSLPLVQLFQYQPVLRVFPCQTVLADQPIRLFSGLNINLFAADGSHHCPGNA